MAFTQEILGSPTGARLNLYSCRAAEARGVIQVNHGLAEHAARYERFAEAMAARGFHVYAHDHRGHGQTKAPGAPLGRFAEADGADKVIADVLAVHDHIATQHPGLPVIVFGHSFGGLVALNFAMSHPDRAAGLAVWNANFSAGALGRVAQGILGWEAFRLGSDVPSRMLPKLTIQAWAKAIPDKRTEFDWLSREPADVDKYVADPLCGWDASVSMWRDVFSLIFRGADDRKLSALPRALPVNLLGGAKDPATDGGKAVEHLAGRMQRMDFSNLVSRVWPDTRHESLNEVNRDVITEEFAGWAEGVADSHMDRPRGR